MVERKRFSTFAPRLSLRKEVEKAVLTSRLRYTILLSFIIMSALSAQSKNAEREYTSESPLIYEDSWNLWPYVFLNHDGKPTGFNVDVITYICRHLRIPFTIHLNSGNESLKHLREGKTDLTIGVKQAYDASFGQLGEQPLVTFTHSVLTPHRDSLSKVGLTDLGMLYFSVREGSFSHHYLSQRGFDQQMNVVDNMEELVMNVATNDAGVVVWDTYSLKWLYHKYHLTNLVISDVDIPSSEFHFLSNDENLLHQFDSMLVVMRSNGEMDKLLQRWMYPEIERESRSYLGANIFMGVLALVILVLILQFIYYYRRSRSGKTLRDVISEMGLVLSSTKTEVWTYDPAVHLFSWMNARGELGVPYKASEFSAFYDSEEMQEIVKKVDEIVAEKRQEATLSLHRKSGRGMNASIPVELRIQPMYDEYKHIYLILGLQRDAADAATQEK